MAKIFGGTTTTPLNPDMFGGSGGAVRPFANAIKNTKSGEVIAVDDVSPIEHDLKVKLSSDTTTNFSYVKVKRYGKNIFKFQPNYTSGQYQTILEQTENSLTVQSTAGANGGHDSSTSNGWVHLNYRDGAEYLSFKQGQKITLSCDYTILETFSDESELSILFAIRDVITKKYGTQGKGVISNDVGLTQRLVVTSDVSVDCDQAYFIISLNSNKVKIENIQVEFSSTYTGYEPFTELTCTANADGTVTGLKSISPTMNILTDTEGVIVNATYNVDTKKYIDRKFAELSQAILNL